MELDRGVLIGLAYLIATLTFVGGLKAMAGPNTACLLYTSPSPRD